MVVLAIKNGIDKRNRRILRRMNVKRILRMIYRSSEDRNIVRRRRTHHGGRDSGASGSDTITNI
jgi:hypothetical protein